METFLLTPEFARLSDWTGLWAMEPRSFGLLVESLRNLDLKAHFEHPPGVLRSALEKISPTRGGQSIAVIKIAGAMMKSQSSLGGGTSTVQLRRDIRQAVSDPEVGGIVLAIDSPGGTVAGTDDLAVEVKNARKTKPVWAHIDDMGASAAYWVASQAEAIYANSATAVVGSIGTVMTVYDVSGMFEKDGVKAFRFATGPLKGAGIPGTPLTKEQQDHFQALIDGSQTAFDDAVKRGRGLTSQQLASVRTGGVFLADSAIGAKLIDGIRPLSKTIDEMARAISGRPTRGANSGAMPGAGSLPMLRQALPMLNQQNHSGDRHEPVQ